MKRTKIYDFWRTENQADFLVKEHIIRNYESLVEEFYRDAQHIIYCQVSLKTKVKMLHSAHYRATYYLSLQNHLLEQELDRKEELNKKGDLQKEPQG